MHITEVLKALADANRLRVMNLLHERKLCVCDLEAILGLHQSNLSRHLAKLKQAGLIVSEKRALFTFYSRAPLPPPYHFFVDALCQAIRNEAEGKSDRRRLHERLKAAKLNCQCD